MKRIAHPPLSRSGQEALALYEHWLREREDLTQTSIRNYLSDLRHFIAWFETEREANAHGDATFTLQAIATPTLTRYRGYLQTVQRQKPASVNRSLISLKRYFGWAVQQHLAPYDPSAAVKLVGQEDVAPRHLDDQEEQALVAAVTIAGNLRDRVLVILLLHTGLRAREICRLRCDQVKLG
jgi:integrase/recombinase XerD